MLSRVVSRWLKRGAFVCLVLTWPTTSASAGQSAQRKPAQVNAPTEGADQMFRAGRALQAAFKLSTVTKAQFDKLVLDLMTEVEVARGTANEDVVSTYFDAAKECNRSFVDTASPTVCFQVSMRPTKSEAASCLVQAQRGL
jgi:hypothetical protein